MSFFLRGVRIAARMTCGQIPLDLWTEYSLATLDPMQEHPSASCRYLGRALGHPCCYAAGRNSQNPAIDRSVVSSDTVEPVRLLREIAAERHACECCL